MSFRIGSFNIQKFSAKDQPLTGRPEERKDIPKIARIIRDSKCDILAIQEIFRKETLDRLLRELGEPYSGIWDKPGLSQESEGYAFIWNKLKFSIPECFRWNLSQSFLPIRKEVRVPYIFDELPVYSLLEKFTRNPLIGSFLTTSAPYVEFRIINTHIVFRDDSKLSHTERRVEHITLCLDVYPKIANQVYLRPQPGMLLRGGLTSYTILLGDFNLNIGKRPELIPFFRIEEGRKTQTIITVQEQDSTLKKPPREQGTKDENINDYWASNYDHFTYDSCRFEGIDIKTSRMDTTKYCKDYAEHVYTISDHVPVFIDIDLKNGK